MRKPLVAVATTTYNMAGTLPRCYESLLKQKYDNFYWLIIDNGSTDDTYNVVQKFIQDDKIKIAYYKKEFGIRATALNMLIDKVNGELCVELHADDELTPDSLEIFVNQWESIPEERRNNYWCIIANCEDRSGRLIGNSFPEGINNNAKKAQKFAFSTVGEKHYAMNVNVLKTKRIFDNPPEGITWVFENELWIRFQREYSSWLVNECTRVYNDDSPSRYTSVKSVSKRARNDYYYTHMRILNNTFGKQKWPIKVWIRMGLITVYNGINSDRSLKAICKDCELISNKLLCTCLYLPCIIRKAIKSR